MRASAQLAAGAALMILALLYLAGARSFPKTEGEPGPGFWPSILGLVLLFLAAALMWEARGALRRPGPVDGQREGSGTLRALLVGGASAAYVALLYRVGFVVGTGLYAACLAAIFKPRRPLRWLGVAGATTLAIHLLFEVALGVRLPRGWWGWAWPPF